MDQETLDTILAAAQIWLETDGQDGRPSRRWRTRLPGPEPNGAGQ